MEEVVFGRIGEPAVKQNALEREETVATTTATAATDTVSVTVRTVGVADPVAGALTVQ